MKKIIFILAFLGLMIYPNSIQASTLPLGFVTDPVLINGSCINTVKDMSLGSTDATSENQVSVAQNILVAKGFLVMPIGVSTGYFGPLTQAALANYQATVGISPAVGYLGPITRGYINAACSNPIPTPTPTGTPIITSISPTSGLAGINVTLTGSGFSQTGNTVHFDIGVVQNISSTDGKTLTFQIPNVIQPACTLNKETACALAIRQTTPGTYNISVYNADNVSSNTVTFEVTGNPIGI